MHPTEPFYLTERELAARLSMSEKTLQYQRCRRTRDMIPYLKIGRAVRYDWRVVEAYLAQRSHGTQAAA